MMSELQQDVVYALRTLKRNIGFTAVVVSALAIGIGANTAIFTLIDAVLVRTLPVPHAEQLVSIGNPARVSSLSQGSPRTDLMAVPVYHDIRANNQLFSDVLASGRAPRLDVRIGDKAGEFEHPRGRFVSGNYFSVLGVKPYIGRSFDASMDDVAGIVAGARDQPRLLDAALSQRSRGPRFDDAARRHEDDDHRHHAAGVHRRHRRRVAGHVDPALDARRVASESEDAHRHRSSWLLLLGRLKPGATLAQATKQVPALIEQSIISRGTPDVVRSFRASDKKYYVQSGREGLLARADHVRGAACSR